MTIEAVHVWRRGEHHVASMDCWCEPNHTLHVHSDNEERPPLPVVVHGDGVIAIEAKKGETPVPEPDEDDDEDEEHA